MKDTVDSTFLMGEVWLIACSIRLGKVDYEILPKVYTELMPDDPAQKEFLDLLHGLHVLEYRNRKTWHDVHPIVVELGRDDRLSARAGDGNWLLSQSH